MVVSEWYLVNREWLAKKQDKKSKIVTRGSSTRTTSCEQ